MSERITEAELSDPNGWPAGWREEVERDRGPVLIAEARFGLRLVAEVRRLRGLIVGAEPRFLHMSPGRYDLDLFARRSGGLEALQAEGRAILAEQEYFIKGADEDPIGPMPPGKIESA